MQADELYWGIGNLLGGLASLATFFGSWWYCAATYGFLSDLDWVGFHP
jgi:hypothetical protein